MAFLYFSEARVGHTILANETQLKVSGKTFADSIHARPLSLSSLHFPLAWNVARGLEERQPHYNYEVTRLKTKVMVIGMAEQKDAYSSSPRCCR